jgi:hypothetical protein
MRALIKAFGIAAAVIFSTPGLTHHSFSAEFDVGRPVEFTGIITRVEWTNPHAWLFLSVRNEDGQAQDWAVELLGINSLMRRGVTRDSIKPGDQLVIEGFGARDGSNTANASTVSRADTGEAIWVSAAGDRTP